MTTWTPIETDHIRGKWRLLNASEMGDGDMWCWRGAARKSAWEEERARRAAEAAQTPRDLWLAKIRRAG